MLVVGPAPKVPVSFDNCLRMDLAVLYSRREFLYIVLRGKLYTLEVFSVRSRLVKGGTERSHGGEMIRSVTWDWIQ